MSQLSAVVNNEHEVGKENFTSANKEDEVESSSQLNNWIAQINTHILECSSANSGWGVKSNFLDDLSMLFRPRSSSEEQVVDIANPQAPPRKQSKDRTIDTSAKMILNSTIELTSAETPALSSASSAPTPSSLGETVAISCSQTIKANGEMIILDQTKRSTMMDLERSISNLTTATSPLDLIEIPRINVITPPKRTTSNIAPGTLAPKHGSQISFTTTASSTTTSSLSETFSTLLHSINTDLHDSFQQPDFDYIFPGSNSIKSCNSTYSANGKTESKKREELNRLKMLGL